MQTAQKTDINQQQIAKTIKKSTNSRL